MKFCVLSMNHHVAPIDIREKVHFKETDIIEATDSLISMGLKEIVILSTCNRSELYFIADSPKRDLPMVYDFLNTFFHVELTKDNCEEKTGDEALRHLFHVAMGLDSLVIGEDQILGQVRDAHLTAMELGGSKKILNKIFREAITFGKELKSQTAISDHPLSLAYIGVKKAEEFGSLSGKKCMVCGLGKMGKLAMEHLLERNAAVSVCNRTYENSLSVQREFPQINIFPFSQLTEGIEDMDVLICSTSSPHTIVKAHEVLPRKKPLMILDLSLPRDVASEVGQMPDITLYTIDDLESLASRNLREKERILSEWKPEAEKRIAELKNWVLESKVDPVLKSLNVRCEAIADDTLKYIFRKTHMTHSEQMKVEKIVRSALKKVMREPILSIKGMEDSYKKEAAIELLEEVFR